MKIRVKLILESGDSFGDDSSVELNFPVAEGEDASPRSLTLTNLQSQVEVDVAWFNPVHVSSVDHASAPEGEPLK